MEFELAEDPKSTLPFTAGTFAIVTILPLLYVRLG